MVFSTDQLYKKENIIDNTPIQKTAIKVSENTSIVIDTLHYILDENILIENELSKYSINGYNNRKKINIFNEDKDINININTPFSRNTSNIFQKIKTNLTIENVVKFIITGFVKLITRIWREFEVICMGLVNKGSQIKRLSNKIYKISVDIPYSQPVYNYTHIIDIQNRADLEDKLNIIYNEFMDFLNTFSNLKNPVEIETVINNFNRDSNNDETFYDELRGQLLGSNGYIFAEDFNEALFKYFRNGQSAAAINNIFTPDQIRTKFDAYNRAPRLIKGYQRDKDKLEKAGNALVSKLQSNKADKYLEEANINTINLFNDLVNRYANKIKNTCQIFVLYYSHRLEAAKDELATNTKILFEVAKYITREGL